MYVLNIIPDTVVDGVGLRTAVYFSGCLHKCKGCHNKESWKFKQGKVYTPEELVKEINAYGHNKVTFSGGDPFHQNFRELLKFLQLLKENKYDVWVYTGYTYEQLQSNEIATEMLKYIDVLVDGKFEESLKDSSLAFRGSSNQRIIDVQNSVNDIVLLNV